MTNEKYQQSSSQQGNRQGAAESAPTESWWTEVLKTLGLSLVLAVGIRTFVAEARFIPSGSMETTLMINDRLIVDKVGYRLHNPGRGDIVVFEPTDTLLKAGYKDAFIKRIVGLPGDKVALENGRVLVNGKRLSEPYVPEGVTTSLEACGLADPNDAFLAKPQVVPSESYLVLGDNRNNSFDGRCWGILPRNRIIGRAALRFWPLDRVTTIPAGEPAADPAK